MSARKGKLMRKKILAVFLVLLVGWKAEAGTPGRVFLPDFLPADTIACLVPPDSGMLEQDYAGSLFHRLGNLPEMAAFFRSFEESRRSLSADIVQAANISPQLAEELVNSRIGLALINLSIGRDGNPAAEFLLSFSLSSQPDRATVFSAVMALLNRPDVVRSVLESQGLDPNLPLRTLAQEETIAGYPPILRVGPAIRVGAIGNMVFIYHGQSSDGIKKIFDAASNPATSLSRSGAFQGAYRGAETKPGMSFVYFNVPRTMAVLDLTNFGSIGRIAESLGVGAAQSIGLAGGYRQEGVRHNLFIYSPGGLTSGVLSAIVPMPVDGRVGLEAYSQTIPMAAEAFMSVRVDSRVLMSELPYFIDSVEAITRPGGIAALVQNERILGVPLPEIVYSLGSDIIVRPHDDTQIMQFNNVDIPAFENIIARMEQAAGARFSSINVGGYIVRYFNRRASLLAPLAPAFCLIPRQQGANQGIMYMASHPQAVVSLIQEAAAAREPLSKNPEFAKASAGLDANYSLYYYNDCKNSYRRVYNFLLPLASVWASSSSYPVDTGLLPTAASIAPSMFGVTVGVKHLQDGMSIQAYSPLGFNGLLVAVADKLVVNNALVLGYVYSLMDTWMATMPNYW